MDRTVDSDLQLDKIVMMSGSPKIKIVYKMKHVLFRHKTLIFLLF
jgi:hypothetical protein